MLHTSTKEEELMRFGRRHLGSLLIGALAVGGVAYVGAYAVTASDNVSLTQNEEEPNSGETERSRKGPHKFGPRGAIRGEFVVPGEDEGTFQRVRTDRGVIDRIEGSTIVISEADGTTVEVPTSDDTRIGRDGEEAELGELKAGDHVHTMRVNTGDGFVTRHVRAVSPERWEEMEQRREECRENREQCRDERRARRMGPRGGPPEDEAA
jgi:hypothetical protein